MIQSRKNLIEDAFYKARGLSTKVILIEQKDNILSPKKVERITNQIEQKNDLKINTKSNQNKLDDTKKIQTKNDLNSNSIDEKAQQFAKFFNGEIVNLNE